MSSSPATQPASSATIEETASRWLARSDAGLSAAEEVEFDRWLSADPRHAAAWTQMEAAWRAFDDPRQSGTADAMVRELAARQHRRRWKKSFAIAAGLTAAAAAAVVVVMLTRPERSPSLASPDSLRVAQENPVATPERSTVTEIDAGRGADASRGLVLRTERRELADGSVVELDRGAKVEVSFTVARRSVRLVRGEALFSVAKDPARPFVVSSGDVDVQAVGTAFAVKSNVDGVDVVVTEGRVTVGRSDAGRAASKRPAAEVMPVFVGAGSRVVVPVSATAGEHFEVETLAAGEMAHRLAWLGARLELASTQLADAAALFNRENHVQLRVEDAQLARLRLSGVFRADDPEGFARLLAANYGVKVTRNGDAIELRGN